MSRCTPNRGFTLIEVVVALAIAAILAAFVVTASTAPINAYLDQSGRAQLSDTAAVISRSLADDLRRALPNSVSVTNAGSRSIIEMVLVDAVVNYERADELSDSARGLDFSPASETQFTVLGYLDASAGNTYRLDAHLVVGNLGRGVGGRNVYATTANPGVITPAGLEINVARNVAARQEAVSIPSGFRFADPGTSGRMFVVRTPVTYICNSATRTLRRFSNYALSPNLPASEAAPQLNQAGVENRLLADTVSSCNVACRTNLTVCDDTLILRISLERTSVTGTTETLRIHEQFPMDNDP
ncbi:MAG TPA: prepilin-type N-terminal cleavage/methylation domain-containing protein [Steroidobacteraceae bacterium]